MSTTWTSSGRGRRMRRAGASNTYRLTHPTIALLSAAAIGLGGAGCRSYEPQPLDQAATRQAWLTRSPNDETARQFADRLAQIEGTHTIVTFDPADGLTLAEAEPVALVFNRELRLARLEAGIARATADNAGQWEDPVAGVDLERIVSGAAEPWVVGATIGLTIPISGRLAVERERAGAAYAAELQRLAAQEWATRAALRELWIEWSAQSHRARLTAELVEQFRLIADLSGKQEAAGVLSRIDARLFTVRLAEREAALIDANARTVELELQIRDILGLSPEAPVMLVETLSFDPRGGGGGGGGAWSHEAFDAGNIELAAVRSEYEVAEQSLRLEVREQYPDLVIGPGYGTDQGDDRVLLGLQLPLPLWNRNRQGVAEAEAERDAARARFESTYEHLASQLAIAQSRYEAGRSARAAVESRVLPLADEQASDVRRVAELGRVDPLMLLEAITAQHDAKVMLIDARAAESIGAIRIDELIGPASASASAPAPSDSKTAQPGDRP